MIYEGFIIKNIKITRKNDSELSDIFENLMTLQIQLFLRGT
jgi:hypothetical protein